MQTLKRSLLILFLALLASCSAQPPTIAVHLPPTAGVFPSTATPLPTHTAQPSPSATPTFAPTATPLPTHTATPAPTTAPTLPAQTIVLDDYFAAADPALITLDLTFSPDQQFLYAADNASVFTGQNGAWIAAWGWTAPYDQVFLSPGGARVATARYGPPDTWTITIWDATGNDLRSFDVPNNGEGFPGFAFSQDGQRLAVKTGFDSIEVQEVDTGKVIYHLQDSALLTGNAIQAMTFSHDGKIVSGGDYQRTFWWDLEAGTARWIFAGCRSNRMYDLDFSPDNKLLAVACAPQETELGFFVLLDTASGEALEFWDETYQYHSLAFSPDGKTIAMGDRKGMIRQFTFREQRAPDTGTLFQKVGEFQAHTAAVIRLLYSQDGRTLVSGSKDGTVKLWSLVQ